jgi:hypothetical protein
VQARASVEIHKALQAWPTKPASGAGHRFPWPASLGTTQTTDSDRLRHRSPLSLQECDRRYDTRMMALA